MPKKADRHTLLRGHRRKRSSRWREQRQIATQQRLAMTGGQSLRVHPQRYAHFILEETGQQRVK